MKRYLVSEWGKSRAVEARDVHDAVSQVFLYPVTVRVYGGRCFEVRCATYGDVVGTVRSVIVVGS